MAEVVDAREETVRRMLEDPGIALAEVMKTINLLPFEVRIRFFPKIVFVQGRDGMSTGASDNLTHDTLP